MDKNMIHIDELVKQRLGGGEEREMPGAWLRMRELLDKEMPEKKRVAGYYNWRRMFGIMTGFVLLSALTVGSYNLFYSSRFGADREKAITAANSRSKAITNSLAPGENKYDNTESIRINASKTKSPNTVNSKTVHESTVASATYTANKSRDKALTKTENKIAINQFSEKKNSGVASEKNNVTPQKTGIITVAAKSDERISKTINHNVIAKDEIALVPDVNISHTASGTLFSTEKAKSSAHTEVQEKPSSKTISQQPKHNYNSGSVADNTKLKTTPAPIQPDRLKDSLNKMQIIQRLTINPLTRSSRVTLDTIAIERFAIDKAENAGNITGVENNAQVAALNPAAHISAADAVSTDALVPLSNFKVQSRKTDRWNARSFDEVVRDVKFHLSQTKFYPGISAGVNSYMFGPNNMGGFQLGLFGLFTFGETWNAMGELKYIQRFNGGATLNDNYIDVVQKQGNYLQGNVEHFFKFTSLQSIEMPLALRYAAGRLNLFGGINMAYHFAVNADEQTLRPADTAYSTFNNPGGKIKVSPTVSYDDFRARFALGGLLGISYELYPSLQLDFRATKNLWDNGYGLGTEQVSSQLYNAPSIQFSIFYRFSQRNQIPKAK